MKVFKLSELHRFLTNFSLPSQVTEKIWFVAAVCSAAAALHLLSAIPPIAQTETKALWGFLITAGVP
jgi:hypothetical protein